MVILFWQYFSEPTYADVDACPTAFAIFDHLSSNVDDYGEDMPCSQKTVVFSMEALANQVVGLSEAVMSVPQFLMRKVLGVVFE